MKRTLILLAFILLAGCAGKENADDQKFASAHPQTMAALYNYYADEYRALAYQAFNLATERLEDLKTEFPARENMAVVVDIDETLLDNSPHQALTILRDSAYPYMWNDWCDLAAARAVPGALDFLQYADEQGFGVFYVSNRKSKYVRESSMKNLKALGFPQVEEDHFMLRLERSETNPNPSDKQARRDAVREQGYEIVMLVGDNLGDFFTDEKNGPARRKQVEYYRNEFGKRFIVLPNAMYGNWPSSIGISGGASMDSLLRDMTVVFGQ